MSILKTEASPVGIFGRGANSTFPFVIDAMAFTQSNYFETTTKFAAVVFYMIDQVAVETFINMKQYKDWISHHETKIVVNTMDTALWERPVTYNQLFV